VIVATSASDPDGVNNTAHRAVAGPLLTKTHDPGLNFPGALAENLTAPVGGVLSRAAAASRTVAVHVEVSPSATRPGAHPTRVTDDPVAITITL
jgi:hypothetical protein